MIEDLIATRELKSSNLPKLKNETPSISSSGTPYFMFELSSRPPQGFTEHHISVFQQISFESGGFSHYSLRNAEKVVHVFFDRFGQFFAAKAADLSPSPSPSSQQTLTKNEENTYKIIALSMCGKEVQKLFIKTKKHFEAQRKTAKDAANHLEIWGKKYRKKRPKSFQKKIVLCADLFKKAARFSLSQQTRATLMNQGCAFQRVARNLTKRVPQEKPPHPTLLAEQPSEPIQAVTESVEDLWPREQKQPTRTVEMIDKELSILSQINDPVERLCKHYQLLQEKCEKIDGNNVNDILKLFKQIDRVQEEAKQELYNCLQNENEQGFNQLLKLRCEPGVDTLFLLIKKGKIDLFKKFYKREHFSLLRHIPCELLKIPRDRMPFEGGGGFLRAAFEADQFSAFEQLLELGCDPGFIIDQKTFFYHVVALQSCKKNGDYASALIDFNVDPNQGFFSPEYLSVLATAPGASVLVPTKIAVPLQKEHAHMKRDMKGFATTPFLLASQGGLCAIVKKMLASGKVDKTQKTKKGFTAIGLALDFAKTGLGLQKEMVKTLIAGGCSIDQLQHVSLEGNELQLTPLFMYSWNQDIRMVQYVHKRGADANAIVQFPFPLTSPKKKKYSFTPFQIALCKAISADDEIVLYLLKNGNITRETIQHCLQFLSKSGNAENKTVLFEALVITRKTELLPEEERQNFRLSMKKHAKKGKK